jgi:hypothetical protein
MGQVENRFNLSNSAFGFQSKSKSLSLYVIPDMIRDRHDEETVNDFFNYHRASSGRGFHFSRPKQPRLFLSTSGSLLPAV